MSVNLPLPALDGLTGLASSRMALDRSRKNVLAIVLAGGEGKRLMPLTADRAKPAVPFAGIYRLIDFALSNVVNSGYLKVVVLTQYKSHSLDRHVTQTWRMSTMLGNYVTPVPAQQRVGKHWYLGSADAIYQSLNLISDEQPDIVVVVGADHVYRMDFSQMVDAARRVSGAACTVAAIRQPIELADQFGVIDVHPDDPSRIREFLEKPTDPIGLPDSPGEVLASMGNYVFDADALVEAVTRDATMSGSKHDMGGDIVPSFVRRQQAGGLRLQGQRRCPASTDRDRGYWRDVGTLGSYYAAHMDVVSPLPVFNLYNFDWPIYTSYGPQPPAKLVQGGEGGLPPTAEDAVLSPGGRRHRRPRSTARCSRRRCGSQSGAEVTDSVLLNGVHDRRRARSCATRSSTRTSSCPPGAQIGVDLDGGPRPRLRGRGRAHRGGEGPARPGVTPAAPAPGRRPTSAAGAGSRGPSPSRRRRWSPRSGRRPRRRSGSARGRGG